MPWTGGLRLRTLRNWLDGLLDAYLGASDTSPDTVLRRILLPSVGPYIVRLAAFAYTPPPPIEAYEATVPPGREVESMAPLPPASAGEPTHMQTDSDDDEEEVFGSTPLVHATVPPKASVTTRAAGATMSAVSVASKERERMVASQGPKGGR